MPVKRQHSRGHTREKSSQRAPGIFVCVYGKSACVCVCAYMRVMPRYFLVNFVAVQAFEGFAAFRQFTNEHAPNALSVSLCRGKRAEKAAV